MKPSKAAIEAARTLIGEYYTAGKPSPAAMAEILQDVYGVQFGDETLYRRYPGSKPFGAIDPKTGAMAMWVVPVGGGEQ